MVKKSNALQFMELVFYAIHGDKPKPRWFIGVITRKDQSYKILDVGYAVYQSIRKLATNPRWGDPSKYDIDIFVDKKGGATGYYTVQPVAKEPLSAENQRTVDNIDMDQLAKMVAPLTPDQVKARIDKIGGPLSQVAQGGDKPATTKPQTVNMADEDADDDVFPDAN